LGFQQRLVVVGCCLWSLHPVLPAGEQLFDNNSGQDYTYPVAAGSSWDEWQAAALERQAEQERERQKAEEVGKSALLVRCTCTL